MKTRLSVIAIALSALVAGHAMAADQVVSKTREQVRAELIEAQRTGNIVADGETGMLLKDLYPSQYPKQAGAVRAEAPAAAPAVAAQGKTRAQVRAELAEAQASGNLIADGETGARFKDLYPSQYPTQATVQAKSRDDVRAELVNSRNVKSN